MYSRRNEHNNNIDALRAFGCLAIIAWHVKANLNFQGSVLAQRIIPSFDYLVYLFMMISGFGMCTGYYQQLKSGCYDLNLFYLKRYKKTIPFFALLIALNCIIDFEVENIVEGLMEITMLFGFLPNNTLSVIGVAWTLGAIFAFYIIFPYVVFLLNNKRRGVAAFVCSVGITFMCQEYFMTDKFVIEGFAMRHSFLFCLPYFLGGGLIYLYKNEICRLVNEHKAICLIGCAALTTLYLIIPDKVLLIDIVVPKTLVLFASWLFVAMGEDNIVLSNRFTAYISRISMEMYLAHMVVFRLIQKLHLTQLFGCDVLDYLATYLLVVLSLIVGITIYRKIERQICLRKAHKEK